MILSSKEEEIFQQLIDPYVENDEVKKMKRFIQHGKITTYQHSLNVARLSFWMNRRLCIRADEKALVTAALLPDFFLYDWHVKRRQNWRHSYRHPLIASNNAVRVFQITQKEQDIISCHMWPYTFWILPKNRESWIVLTADKIVSLIETVNRR